MIDVRLKPALRWLHRWVGLTLGLLFAIVGISGSLLLFQPQFFRWAHGEMIPAGLSQQIGSVDRWVENARAVVPPELTIDVIWRPQQSHNVSDAGMIAFEGSEPGGFGHTGFRNVIVAPDSGKVLGVIDVDRSPAYAPVFFHGALWAGAIGRLLLGIVAVGGCIMLAIGLYLWWPGRRQVLSKLSPRPLRNLQYAARLHDWTGGWMFVVLLVLAMTGLYLAQPDWIEPALKTLPASATARQPDAGVKECGAPISLDQALAKASALVPGSTWTEIVADDESMQRRWEIALRTGTSSAVHRETHVLADLRCGSVAIETTPKTRSARESVELWFLGLHDGTVLGAAGEVFITVAGLTPLVLLWSGMSVWLRRRARRRVQSA